jgi:hypothetical protein
MQATCEANPWCTVTCAYGQCQNQTDCEASGACDDSELYNPYGSYIDLYDIDSMYRLQPFPPYRDDTEAKPLPVCDPQLTNPNALCCSTTAMGCACIRSSSCPIPRKSRCRARRGPSRAGSGASTTWSPTRATAPTRCPSTESRDGCDRPPPKPNVSPTVPTHSPPHNKSRAESLFLYISEGSQLTRGG